MPSVAASAVTESTTCSNRRIEYLPWNDLSYGVPPGCDRRRKPPAAWRVSRGMHNPQIDMVAYLKAAHEAAAHRESHRVSEAEFIRMSQEPGTIVLDARSR